MGHFFVQIALRLSKFCFLIYIYIYNIYIGLDRELIGTQYEWFTTKKCTLKAYHDIRCSIHDCIGRGNYLGHQTLQTQRELQKLQDLTYGIFKYVVRKNQVNFISAL